MRRPSSCDIISSCITFFLITFIPSTSIYFIFQNFYSRVQIILFILLVCGIHCNYFTAMFTPPGSIPKTYSHPSTLIQTKASSKPRYCRHCRVPKPQRSHHCSECGCCVLKLDHHCNWICNCIGYANYPFFYRFLLYVVLALCHGLFLISYRIYALASFHQKQVKAIFDDGVKIDFVPPLQPNEIVFVIINTLLMFIVLLGVGILFIYHTSYILSNTSTIESLEIDKVTDLVRRGSVNPEDAVFPFDLGWRRNISTTFGTGFMVLFWKRPPGDGLSFPVNRAGSVWPPAAYLEFRNGKYGGGRVRRGSEGYLVKEYTPQEREAMISAAIDSDNDDCFEDDGDDFMDELSSEEEHEPLHSLRERLRTRTDPEEGLAI